MVNITSLNHINIRTNKMEETKDFYLEVLGLTVGFRPPFNDHGYWLYCGEQPIVHLSPAEEGVPPRTNRQGMGDGLDHIGLQAKGLDDMIAHLEGLGVAYQSQLAAGDRLVQLFIDDPNGVTVEVAYVVADEGVDIATFEPVKAPVPA